ncbi:MAG TPA: adenylate/guanylate cyclase domain-containing protein [Dehalococcoidia bacterium]|jgi:class 3 adenylate cyclase|nr:adenylate/guanylate cyclase domain-containing protein [Dehalococcoidia bacterium]
MDREVRYVTTADGVRIAYAVQGEGLPFIWVPGWISHLDLDAGFLQMFGVDPAAQGVLWIQMDKRGSGLSSRNISDYSLEARVGDVIAVADDLSLETFALGGMSEGGPIALATAATHPNLVTKLVIHGSYANGECIGGSPDMRNGLLAVIKAEWGVASKLISDLFTDKNSLMNGEQFAGYQRVAANHNDARRIIEAAIGIDVRSLLPEITAPTLVIHHRDDRIIPIENGQEIAAGIKGARFLSFPGAHIAPLEDFKRAFTAILDFVSAGSAAQRTAAASADSTFRTVLFTDIVGHTAMMRRLGDEKGRGVLRDHERVTRDVLKANGGSEVKTMGDGFMASFTSITKGVECAIALQRAFDERNASAPEPVTIRVGLNAGEPIQEDGDLFGETVILAARIAAKAEGAEILVANTVRELCSGKGFLFADRGEFVAKGFEEPVRVHEVRWRE